MAFHASSPVAADNMSVPVPEMGDSITEGTVLEWVKGVGDYVAMDDVVVVIETDKVSVDVRAPAAGVITATFGELDDVVVVGSPLMEIDTDAAAPEGRDDPGHRDVEARGELGLVAHGAALGEAVSGREGHSKDRALHRR